MMQKQSSIFWLLAYLLLVQVTSCHQDEKTSEVLQSTVLVPIYYEYNYERIEQKLLENICLQFRWLHQRLTKEAISAFQAKSQILLEVKTTQKKISELTDEIIKMYSRLLDEVSNNTEILRKYKIEIVEHQVQKYRKKCKEEKILICEEGLSNLLEHFRKEVQKNVEQYEKRAKDLIFEEDQEQSLSYKYSLNVIPINEPFEKDWEMSQEYYQQWKQYYDRNGRFDYDYSDYYNYVNDRYLQNDWMTLTRKLIVALQSRGKQCGSDYNDLRLRK